MYGRMAKSPGGGQQVYVLRPLFLKKNLFLKAPSKAVYLC